MIVLVTQMNKKLFMWWCATQGSSSLPLRLLCWGSGSVWGGDGGGLSWDGLSDPSGGMVGR